MSGDDLRDHADRFLAAATAHPECLAGRVISLDENGALVELDINVEMPLGMRVDGTSPNGVRRIETVRATLYPSYPWSAPSTTLRADFPRALPHLQPASAGDLPRPCLVDGNPREYFFQFGLLEAGIFHLIHQLLLWLQRAALGELIDPDQGWEPTFRRDLSDILVISAETCRATVDRNGGHCAFRARYIRSGSEDKPLGQGAGTWITATSDRVPLSRHDQKLFTSRDSEGSRGGATVCGLIWPDKLPSGEPFVADSYMPETVSSFGALRERARDLGCERALRVFLDGIEWAFRGFFLERSIPVAIILCARRPCHLIGSNSCIELLPYVIEIRPARERMSLIAGGDCEPATPAMQLDSANPELLQSVSGASVFPPAAMLGCGSVGSKMAMHLGRTGILVPVVCDKGFLLPHNMARHALARSWPGLSKAGQIAEELSHLGQSPRVHKADLVTDLAARDTRKIILPKQAGYAINTTASLAVREALSALAPKELKPRLVEAALFGRGYGGFLLIEGSNHNPTLCDLIGELYATVWPGRVQSLLFDPDYGLREIQIGQGCSSRTMPMSDMRLSAMTASLTEELIRADLKRQQEGVIVVGTASEERGDTVWSRRTVPPFVQVSIEGAEGWTVRISERVLKLIREEMARFSGVETGGLLIGLCSARLRTVTVVDALPAPGDSERSPARFVLGTQGLKHSILSRHQASGGSLFDVGTWHSHLTDQGASALDRNTARTLAHGRPPPSVLLIATPNHLYALMHSR